MTNWTTIVAPSDLAAALGQPGLVLVDCRHALADADAGERDWRASHLPGAGHAHLDRDLSDHRKPPSHGRHPLPEAEDFNRTLARLGVNADSQVVAYDAGDGSMAAARLWWLLRLMGHSRVAVLDGGVAAWRSLGLAMESAAPRIAPGHYAGHFNAAAIATADDVAARLGEAPGWLVDARAPERFRGDVEPLDPVAGHIPGAVNRPFAANLDSGRLRSPSELRADFQALIGERAPADVVLSCGSGVTACHNLLAMAHAGLDGARVYAGSWSGWVSDRSRPVARDD
ncbi:MAG: sulfurtransferase [Arenimonas sp.]|uniref:sulfurtransferase n=1 Tax=Arenimonas sp. TaxID=1872635 RepID=UPI0025BB9A33|nr:sulfurtransferase [Arenimonas sp.]MBW8367601.1 sulfurtransferase [Arenimonas sp.]